MLKPFLTQRGSTMRFSALLLILPFVAACSSESGFSSVQGKVLYEGKPIKGAVVIFHPKSTGPDAQVPSGITDEDGVFTVASGLQSGAPNGQYTVTITWPGEKPEAKVAKKKISTEQDTTPPPDQLKGRYADAKSSTIQVTVSGSTRLDPFDLK